MTPEKYQQLKKVIQEANPDSVLKFMGVKIYGREIRLADVMLALYSEMPRIAERIPDWHLVCFKLLSKYNLRNDNLDNQTDECKQFLSELLT